jgi:hypothetical protein
MKDKNVSKKIFSKTAVFLIIGVVSLTLTGWGFSGNSTKAKDLRVTNQTKALQVEHAEIVGDTLKLALRNTSEKTINGVALAFNGGLIQIDYTIGDFTFAPGQIEERTYPCDPQGSRELEVQVVVFTDRSFDGTVTAARSILHRREGIKTQLQAIQTLLDKTLESPDNQLAGNLGHLMRQVSSLSEEVDHGSRNRDLRSGLRDAKQDVRKSLQSLIQESSENKKTVLRQRLMELRSQVAARANRL